MLDQVNLFLFVIASVLLIIAPGPDIIFLIAQGVAKGPRAGVTLAMGLAMGNLTHTLGAALGISVVFQTSVMAFQILKLFGVAYLLYLAYKTFRTSVAPESPMNNNTKSSSLFWRGVLMNNLNPKVVLFFLAFLPQFISTEAGPVWLQMILLGLIFIILVIVIFVPIGIFSGKVNQWIKGRNEGRFDQVMRWVVPAVFVSLAVRLALVEQ